MSDQLNIRGVTSKIRQWIDEERFRYKMQKNEFLLKILEQAASGEALQPSLFDLPRERVVIRPNTFPFRFIDLFAGIGGFRLGLEAVGGKCLFSCEYDKYAQKTYYARFGETPAGDIRDLDPSRIPSHHVLAAGFPCQPFSIAGVSKKNSLGKSHGFKDQTQGNLFFVLASIIERQRPPVILLENVKNLKGHDKGKTWDVISKTLAELDYKVYDQIIDASAYVPQHRERIFIVGFNQRIFGNFVPFRFPDPPSGPRPILGDILESEVEDKYTLTDHLWGYLQQYAEKHKERGNGFGFGLADPKGITRTLSARYFKDGSEILIPQGRKKNPRRLTPRECARLMGFPDDHPIPVSDTQAYKQFGNALVPAMAEAVGRQIVHVLTWHFHEYGSLAEQLHRVA